MNVICSWLKKYMAFLTTWTGQNRSMYHKACYNSTLPKHTLRYSDKRVTYHKYKCIPGTCVKHLLYALYYGVSHSTATVSYRHVGLQLQLIHVFVRVKNGTTHQ